MKWTEELDKILSSVITTGSGGLLVGVARGVVKRYGGFKVWLSLLVASTLVAALAGLALHDTGLSTPQQSAIIGICAFLAEDILLGLGALSSLFAKDPIGTVKEFWNAIRGKETPPK